MAAPERTAEPADRRRAPWPTVTDAGRPELAVSGAPAAQTATQQPAPRPKQPKSTAKPAASTARPAPPRPLPAASCRRRTAESRPWDHRTGHRRGGGSAGARAGRSGGGLPEPPKSPPRSAVPAERRPGVTKCPGAGPRHRTADQPLPAAGRDLWAAVPPPSAARTPPVALHEGCRGRHRANRQLKKAPHSRAAPPDKVRWGRRAGTPRRSDRPGRCPRTPCGCPTPLWLGGAGQVRSYAYGHLSAYPAD